ncbi:glycosyltransferase family 2 protein [Campylobacter lari]|uniref:glycosyltransferase family 2 protein n=1 Tax=Campylobacter lari TaxID=201 RepID=UPI001BD24936|nr:glycosyltransferase family 2 protein [Campylobacter lari]MBT0794178.1 glycosyltransferase family 2 protein [Campylobacter lari]
MQTKTVGIVIPIYNVEKYLKECLDSVINQTYTNLEIILVNDGSTDENSLNIAKEYTLKDKRITLFDKKNGGLSSARNVGIEYFSGEYKLKNKTQTIKENSLIEFNIEGNNPYEIYTIYKSYKAFNDEQDLTNFTYPIIDYIIFLDSDDYWELNCIEECVPRMDGVEVLWFDSKRYYDNIEIPSKIPNTLFESYGFSFECLLSKNLWVEKSLELNVKSFWFSVMGMIDFAFLRSIKLKFLDGIIHEDNLFGVLLFFQVKNIFVLPSKMYIHRMRPNSTMNHDKKITKSNITQYMLENHNELGYDAREIKFYSKTYSWCTIALKLIEFLENFIMVKKERELLNVIIREYYKASINAKRYTSKDPRGVDFYLNQIAFYLGYGLTHNNQVLLGATDHIKNQLCYKLGNQIVKSTSLVKIFLLPYRLLLILINHKIEKKILKIMSKKDPKYKTLSLNSYTDHMVALEVKNHLSYKIGQVLIRDCKNWYKGGIFKLPYSMYKAYKDYKGRKK